MCRVNAIYIFFSWWFDGYIPPSSSDTDESAVISSGSTGTAYKSIYEKHLKKTKKKKWNLTFFDMFLKILLCTFIAYVLFYFFFLYRIVTALVLYFKKKKNLVVNKGMRCATVDRLCPKYLFASGFLSSCCGSTVNPLPPPSLPPPSSSSSVAEKSQSDSSREQTVIMWTSDIM